LQQVIVDVSGKPFEEFMQSEVLRPLGMTSSTFAQPLPESLLPIVATGHYAGGRAMPGRFRISPELTAAGLWSTPTDIAKYPGQRAAVVRRSSGGAVGDGSNASNAKSRSPQPRARPCHQRRRGFHSLWS
jgi:CubicO group peptidase (beta-lactamase class C family)